MNKEFLILDYKDNFADNLSSCAYASILQNKFDISCYRENLTQKREVFENKMSFFDLEYNYISSAKVEYFSELANKYNKIHLNSKNIFKKRPKDNKFADLGYLQLNDIDKIDSEFISKITFKNNNFIKNHDILEAIEKNNSIGIYISNNDLEENRVDISFINNALKRLNKYVKKPKLFIFTKKNLNRNFDLDMDYKIISLNDWKEEFYFLKVCKHKIILNAQNSYSINLWASILNQKSYYYTIYDKKINKKINKINWIGI